MNNTFITTLFKAYNSFKRVGIFSSSEFHANWMSEMKQAQDRIDTKFSNYPITDFTHASLEILENDTYTQIKDLLARKHPVHVTINVTPEKEIISISQPNYINPKIYNFFRRRLREYLDDFFFAKAIFEGKPIQVLHTPPESHWIFFSKIIYSLIKENIKVEQKNISEANASYYFIIG